MIFTLILVGLIFGRWWRATLIASVVGWPVLLVALGITHNPISLAGAVGLAAVNAGLGVAVHQGIARVARRLRR
jgi:multidrug efflux pump subunit AcrB